jgi:hypothetical protein
MNQKINPSTPLWKLMNPCRQSNLSSLGLANQMGMLSKETIKGIRDAVDHN